jgi:hypothetical protein
LAISGVRPGSIAVTVPGGAGISSSRRGKRTVPPSASGVAASSK